MRPFEAPRFLLSFWAAASLAHLGASLVAFCALDQAAFQGFRAFQRGQNFPRGVVFIIDSPDLHGGLVDFGLNELISEDAPFIKALLHSFQSFDPLQCSHFHFVSIFHFLIPFGVGSQVIQTSKWPVVWFLLLCFFGNSLKIPRLISSHCVFPSL